MEYLNAEGLLKKYKQKEIAKYWKAKDDQERLERLLHNNTHILPEKQEKRILPNLKKLLHEIGVDCKQQGNQIFLNPKTMEKAKETFELFPKSVRSLNREIGKLVLVQWFEQQLKEGI